MFTETAKRPTTRETREFLVELINIYEFATTSKRGRSIAKRKEAAKEFNRKVSELPSHRGNYNSLSNSEEQSFNDLQTMVVQLTDIRLKK